MKNSLYFDEFFEVVISTKCFYFKGLNTSVTSGILSEIQKSIRQKDEEMSWVDACCLQIAIKSSKGSRGAESCTFQTRDPNIKKEWIVGKLS